MKPVYYCLRCGSTNLWRDAAKAVNDPDLTTTYDSLSCGNCSYEGHTYGVVDVEDPDEIDEFIPDDLKPTGQEVRL